MWDCLKTQLEKGKIRKELVRVRSGLRQSLMVLPFTLTSCVLRSRIC